jgi:hypothetical protein
VLDYPYISQLTSARSGGTTAWVRNLKWIRNVWIARAPQWTPQQVTHYSSDRRQEITQLSSSPDGARLVHVLGGDDDADFAAAGDLAPDPQSSPVPPVTSVWTQLK